MDEILTRYEKYLPALIAVLILAGYALTRLILFLNRCSKLSKEFALLKRDLETILNPKQFVDLETLNKISDRLEKSSLTRNSWRAYYKTIIQDDQLENIRIFSTQSYKNYLLLPELLDKELGAKSFAKTPAIVTSGGLFFTFLYIVIGLGELNFDSTPSGTGSQDNGIQGLISNLSAKFISSISAILFSILLTIVEDKQLENIEAQYHDVIELLEHKFNKQTTEDYLKNIDKTIGHLNNTMSLFSTDLANKIKSGLEEGMKPSTERLLEVINNLEKQKNENTSETFEKMLKEFSENLKGSAGAEFKEMGEAIQKMSVVMNESTEHSSRMSAEIEKLISALNVQATQNEKSSVEVTSKMQKSFTDLLESVEQGTKRQSETLEKMLNEMVMKTSGATNTLITQVEGLSGQNRDVVSGFEKLNNSISESIESYRLAIDSSKTFVVDTKNLVSDIRLVGEKLTSLQKSTSENQERSIQESKVIQEIQKQNAVLNSEFSKSFPVVEKGLKEVLNQLGVNFERYKNLTHESLGTYLKEYDTSLSTATNRLKETVNEMGETLDDLSDSINELRKIAEDNRKK